MKGRSLYLFRILICIFLFSSTGCEKTQEQVDQKGKNLEGRQFRGVVKSGQIVIDEQRHWWDFGENSIGIEMYLRNKGEDSVNGTLVFEVTLDGQGLEERWIQQFIDEYSSSNHKLFRTVLGRILSGKGPEKDVPTKGFREILLTEDALISLFNNEKTKWSLRFPSIISYIDRGKTLPDGKDYEPVVQEQASYRFKFRKDVSLRPGELIDLMHTQPIPPSKEGFLFDLKLERIEFGHTVSQFSTETPTEIGRYQFHNTENPLYVLDTKTGIVYEGGKERYRIKPQ